VQVYQYQQEGSAKKDDFWMMTQAVADFSGANLADVNLTQANLTLANLTGANLTGANLTHANLTLTDLTGANLTGVNFYGARLDGTIFEPSINPAPYLMALTYVDRLTWDNNPAPIFALRKSFLEGGFSDQANRITVAIHRKDQSWLEMCLFDRTCEWGANWFRPLSLVGLLSLFCTVIY
jgi:hypothetical protein